MIRIERTFGERRLVIGEATADDVPAIVRYWYESDPALLERIGIDREKLPSRAARARFFDKMIGSDPWVSGTYLLAGRLDDAPVGYALFNHFDRASRTCQGHLHVIDDAARGRGLVSLVFADVVGIVFAHLGVSAIVCEPCATNAPINALLRKMGHAPVRTYAKAAQGIVRAMPVNRYEIRAPARAAQASPRSAA